MQGKTLFLERVISRTREWQCRFPALCERPTGTFQSSSGYQHTSGFSPWSPCSARSSC